MIIIHSTKHSKCTSAQAVAIMSIKSIKSEMRMWIGT